MNWSPQQDAALQGVAKWLHEGDQQVYRLFGYAGTGKTTLAKHFAEGVDGTVLFGAFTGKAAYVLRTKGCPGATTIHSMIYHTKDKGRAHLLELEAALAELRAELHAELAPDEPRENVDYHPKVQELSGQIELERNSLSRPSFSLNMESTVKDATMVVIDECSMVDGRMGEDLLSFGKKVLVLGDPAQLPPVHGAGFFTEVNRPDFMLEEIHRQAADNPIIAMATKVRLKEKLEDGRYGESLVTSERLTPEQALEADQILVGRNVTRTGVNRRVRSLLKHEHWHPVPGDRLICLRNNHDKGLLNGAIWHATEIGDISDERIVMTLDPDLGGDPTTVEAHSAYFKGEEVPFWNRKDAEEFDYGYGVTVHKSQGSQWDDVLLFDESYCFRENRHRWLYTGITRAAEKVIVVRT